MISYFKKLYTLLCIKYNKKEYIPDFGDSIKNEKYVDSLIKKLSKEDLEKFYKLNK